MKKPEIIIGNKKIGRNHPVYIVAEMSANHDKDFNKAIQIIKEAKRCGADAVKLQTYTADSLTIDSSQEYFKLTDTIWKGKTLYELYSEASTPWDWIPRLQRIAQDIGIELFSTPFDFSAVNFLKNLNMPAYKIASFEIIDIPLLKKVADTGKPVILSTGMASYDEIKEAVSTLETNGCREIILLKCTSAYPAKIEEANLKTIPHLHSAFHYPVGISDHTLGQTVSMGAVALGASMVEKHFTLSRDDSGPDSAFSMEPNEFKKMTFQIRSIEKALGKVSYGITDQQKTSVIFRRSLFAVQDISKGEQFTENNIRSIRPSYGLHPRYLHEIIGKSAVCNIQKGTPLKKEMITQH